MLHSPSEGWVRQSHMDLRLRCTGYSASQAGEGPRVPGVIMKPAVTRRCEQVEPKARLL